MNGALPWPGGLAPPRGPSAPFIRTGPSAPALAWTAVLCLAPSAAWGVFLFGLQAALVLAVSTGTALAAEALCSLLRREFTLLDGSALLSGLLVGCLLPAGVPLYVPAAASGFALVVVKHTFGGLGRNWMNPALAGVVFARVSWPAAFAGMAATRWTAAGPAPLDGLRAALASGRPARGGAFFTLAGAGVQPSGADAAVVGWLNSTVLGRLGLSGADGAFDLLVGIRPGGIGEAGVPLLLAAAAVLIARRVIRWEIPAASVGVFGVLTWALGGLATGSGLFAGSPVFHLAAGSLLLVCIFMATDPVTSPLTRVGRILSGCSLGCLAFLLRFHGSLGDGSALALLLVNCMVPLLDRWTRPARARLGGAL
jgi:Na+-translocating ferredoxin:NAD+ oxidoreductase subunit D